MLTTIVLSFIGMIGGLVLAFIGHMVIIYALGGRIKFRPLRIEYTEPVKGIRKKYTRRIERRMKKHPPTEPYEIHVRKYVLQKTRFLIKLAIISYVLFILFAIADWCVFIWSTWQGKG